MYRNLVQQTITKNLDKPLNAYTAEDWQSAFNALAVLQYHSPWINGRIELAAKNIYNLPVSFQKSLLELLHSNYPELYYTDVKLLLMQTNEPKIFALCANYILKSTHALEDVNFLAVKTKQQMVIYPDNPVLQQLLYQLEHFNKPFKKIPIELLLNKNYLPGQVLVISFQRNNRDYPGLVMVRNASGDFIKDSTGQFFSVPQLARSITNLPGYLSNGNTAEGIYRMKNYDVSRSIFIGPTVNIQLSMPFEKKSAHFYNNPSLTDTTWNINMYRNLLPDGLRDYYPLYQTYYAGKAGRTEIIIHGTTLNPNYYSGKPYYPLTPTMGCLTSKEIWNEQSGQREESDQQLLINTMIKAGGANGYAIVVNIDDAERPVLLADILPLLEKAGQH